MCPLFQLERAVTLEWDDEAGVFIPEDAAAAAFDDATGWFDDGDVQFLSSTSGSNRGDRSTGTVPTARVAATLPQPLSGRLNDRRPTAVAERLKGHSARQVWPEM